MPTDSLNGPMEMTTEDERYESSEFEEITTTMKNDSCHKSNFEWEVPCRPT